MSQEEMMQGADLRVLAHDLRSVSTKVDAIAEGMQGLRDGLNTLTGQLSVRCPAEEERLAKVEAGLQSLRTEAFAALDTRIDRINGRMIAALVTGCVALLGMIGTLLYVALTLRAKGM